MVICELVCDAEEGHKIEKPNSCSGLVVSKNQKCREIVLLYEISRHASTSLGELHRSDECFCEHPDSKRVLDFFKALPLL